MTNMVLNTLIEQILPLPLDLLNVAHLLKRYKIAPVLLHLDGGHDSVSVMADLAAWWPMIRPGGVLIGDDYSPDGSMWPNVKKAFDEYFGQLGLTPFEVATPKCRIRKPAN